MGCLVSSSLWREISGPGLIPAHAAWPEREELIPGFSCVVFHFISCPSSSRDRWLWPREASWRLQLEVPVLPQTFGETGAQDCRYTQDGADVRAKISTLPLILPPLLKYSMSFTHQLTEILSGTKVSSPSLNKLIGTQQRQNGVNIYSGLEKLKRKK